MDDLRRRFAVLDRVPVPDVWGDVERRLQTLGAPAPTGRLVVTPGRTASIASAPGATTHWMDRRPTLAFLIAAAVVAALVLGGLAVGAGIFRSPSVVPPSLPSLPSPQASLESPAPSPAQTSPRPTPDSTTGPAAAGSWTVADSLPRDRSGESVSVLHDGRVLVAGGESGGTYFASAELYDPASGLWTPTGSMHDGRRGHAAIVLADGRVLVAGGWNQRTGQAFASAELYDPASGTWSETGSMTRWRYAPKATLLQDGRVLVVGGMISGGGITKGAETYDAATGTWAYAQNMSGPPGTATLLGDGRVLVVHGGKTPSELYDPRTGRWSSAAAPAGAIAPSLATLLANGDVLVLGGVGDVVDTAESYDPAADTWALVAPPPTGRGPATLLADGSVLVIGAQTSARYDPATAAWITVAAAPSPNYLYQGIAVRLLDGRVFAIEDGRPDLFDPTGSP